MGTNEEFIKLEKKKAEMIPWTFHPRVFISLGAELVTNDLVALVELVKNAYDAFAHRVDIRFIEDVDTSDQILEIQDDGHGMDRKTIIKSWFIVATPYKEDEKTVKRGKKTRRVAGEKGLGRLSAARLGGKLRMYTKKIDEPCYCVDVDWDSMANATDLSECSAEIRLVQPPDTLGDHGTFLRIQQLRRAWNFDKDSDLPDLRMELARFVPPFKEQTEQTDFHIYLTTPKEKRKSACIQPPKILSHPTYIVKGEVDERGILTVNYQHVGEEHNRYIDGRMNLNDKEPRLFSINTSLSDSNVPMTECGPFDFEFRVWNVDKEALLELGKRFDLGKKVTTIRRQISDSPFSGITLYRDGILVLPKEIGGDQQEGAAKRDWLGLNLRSISRVGTRIRTSQMIGYVNISGDDNSDLRDTADRERLVDNAASRQFRNFIYLIIRFLEQERDKDRTEPRHQEPPLQDLFAALRSTDLPNKLEEIEKRKGDWDEIHRVVSSHTKELDAAVDEIQQRFYYYSRLASVGSLALLLQHEVGNKVPVISELNRCLRENELIISGLNLLPRRLELSENAVRSLQRLANIFSPLANRTFKTRRRNSIIEEIISQIIEWHEKIIHRLHVEIQINSLGSTKVAVDPGELTPIIDNLMTNSLYWIREAPFEGRKILVDIFQNKDIPQAEVRFHDSGPGIEDGFEEKIFWPGITKKKGGIGMGLTVASEIVAQHNGKMYLVKPGELGGASFGFDLPLVRK